MRPTLQLRILLLAWLGGIWLGTWLGLTLAALLLLMVLTISLTYQPSWMLALGVLFFGGVYQAGYSQIFYPDNFSTLVGQTLELRAEVQGEVRVRGGRQTVRLKVRAWRQNEAAWQPLTGQLLWPQALLPRLGSGEVITVRGTVTNLVSWSDEFDARAYWSRWGVTQQLIRAELLDRPPPTTSMREDWRATAQSRLSHHLDQPHQTVALGMLVGLKEKLPKSLDDAFKQAGLTHLLVVSGTNITLLLLALSLVLKPLGPWWRYGLGLTVIVTYLYLVGFDPPALRATLLGIITGLALTAGWFCEWRNVFLLVAVGLTVYDPRFLTHDVSFHLSFVATAGMLWGTPLLYPGLSFIPGSRVRLLLCATVCAQVAVFPILITQFGSFPYVGLVTNLVTEPLVPLIMLLAAGGVVLGATSLLGLVEVWSTALWGSLEGLIQLAQLGAALPTVTIPPLVGFGWGLLLLAVALWGSLSQFYQRQFWEKLEAEIG